MDGEAGFGEAGAAPLGPFPAPRKAAAGEPVPRLLAHGDKAHALKFSIPSCETSVCVVE